MRPYVVAGGTAVVTGAGSGIGAALAAGLAARGSHLALLDRHADRLDAVAAAVRTRHPACTVRTDVVDLADAEATARVAQVLLAELPRVTLLVNDAGVALAGRFDQVTPEEFFGVLDVNLRATVRLTHALLPALRASPGSHLVNLSSVFGLVAPPGQTAYATSKFAIRGFTESLRAELAGSGVGVTVVHPGGVRTRIAQDARVGSGVSPEEAERYLRQFERLLTIDPADAAEAIIRGVERRRPRVLIGSSARVPDLLARVLPATSTSVLARVDRLLRRRVRA